MPTAKNAKTTCEGEVREQKFLAEKDGKDTAKKEKQRCHEPLDDRHTKEKTPNT